MEVKESKHDDIWCLNGFAKKKKEKNNNWNYLYTDDILPHNLSYCKLILKKKIEITQDEDSASFCLLNSSTKAIRVYFKVKKVPRAMLKTFTKGDPNCL